MTMGKQDGAAGGMELFFSSKSFPLHQEKMNQLVEMGVGVGGGGKWRGCYCLRKDQVELLVPPSCSIQSKPLLLSPPAPLGLLFSSSSQEGSQVSLGQNLSSQESRKTHRLKINNHRTPQHH